MEDGGKSVDVSQNKKTSIINGSITINWKTLITLAVTIGTSISILTVYQSKVDNLERRMEEVERYNPELMDYKLSQIIIIARELEEYHKTPKTSEYNDTRSD